MQLSPPDTPEAGAPALLLQAAGLGLWRVALPSLQVTLSHSASVLLRTQTPGPGLLSQLLACVDARDRAALASAFDGLAAGDGFDVECRLAQGSLAGQAADRPVWLRWRCPARPLPGAPWADGSVQDISERKQLEAALQARQTAGQDAMARAMAVLDAVPDLCFVISADGRYLEVSRADHPSLAVPWEQVRGRRFVDVVPEAVATLAGAALQRAIASGGVERIEYSLATLDGTDHVFEARIAAMTDGHWLYLTRDMSEAAAAQQALRESEARYARAMRGTSDGLWDWDVRTGLAYLSPRWKALLGMAPDELADIGDSFFGRIHPDDVGQVSTAMQAHFDEGQPFDVEMRLRMKSAAWRWFRARGELERDEGGQPLRMSGSIADIEARKAAEDALRDSQARFSAIFQTAPVGILLSAPEDGRVIEVNGELGRILGWAPAEMVGRSTIELGIWPDKPQRDAFVGQLRDDGRTALIDSVMRHRGGRAVFAQLSAQRMQIGGRVLLLSAITDVSDRRAAEQALREQREAYEAIFNAASDAIVSVDAMGRILIFNPGAERIFQRRADTLTGAFIHELLPPSQWLQRKGGGFVAFAGSCSPMVASRLKGLRADGQELELEAAISSTVVAGRVVITAILRDISERVRAEAAALRHSFELSALTRRLLEQEKQTTQRLAQAMHDQLGQTLTALRLTLDHDRRAVPAGAAADQRRQQASALVDQALKQVRQVLIDLRPPLLEEEGLYAALDNEVRSRAALHAGVDLLLRAPAAARCQRWAAEVEYALFMVAREALDNALRHADATLVRVSLEGTAEAVRIEVTDDGVGIASEVDRARPGHLGLIGMAERGRAIGARLSIDALPTGGTRLAVRWEMPQ